MAIPASRAAREMSCRSASVGRRAVRAYTAKTAIGRPATSSTGSAQHARSPCACAAARSGSPSASVARSSTITGWRRNAQTPGTPPAGPVPSGAQAAGTDGDAVADPHHAAVAGQQAVLVDEVTAGGELLLGERHRALAILGVNARAPEVGLGHPLLDGVAQQRLDAAVDEQHATA